MDYLISSASQLVLRAVEECKSKGREKMGRGYASGHEAWAKIKELCEQAKRDEKTVDKLHGEVWEAIKDRNDEEVGVELKAIANEATNLAMTYAIIAAEARRASEELLEGT